MTIIEASQLPSDEKVHLKKGWFGEWRVVYPIKNEDGSWNWFNLICGSWSNLLTLIFIILIGVTIYYGIHELIGNYQIIADNPCDFCYNCQEQTRKVITSMRHYNLTNTLNFSNMKLG